MKAAYSNSEHSLREWPIGQLQLVWWFVSATGLVISTILNPAVTPPLISNIYFASLYMICGLGISSVLMYVASRLNLLSWHPARLTLGASVGFLLGVALFIGVIYTIMRAPSERPREEAIVGVFFYIFYNFLAWTLGAMLVGHAYRAQLAKREALGAHLENAEAELRFMRQQVNSHLVFNALNSIMAAIEEKSPKVESMVLDLSNLLRQSLETLPYMGTLGDELDRVKLYTRIAKSRYEDLLAVALDLTDDLLDLPCLPMVLQPLVENAIKHGFAQNTGPLRIDVSAERRDDRLLIRVTNQGQLVRDVAAGSGNNVGSYTVSGIGLHTVRHRLVNEYGDEALLEMAETTTHGEAYVTATIGWPIGHQCQLPEQRAVS